MPSGFWLVTRCEPRTLVSASKILSRVMPRCFSSCAAGERPVSVGDREKQVLGADELVLQAIGFGLRQHR